MKQYNLCEITPYRYKDKRHVAMVNYLYEITCFRIIMTFKSMLLPDEKNLSSKNGTNISRNDASKCKKPSKCKI